MDDFAADVAQALKDAGYDLFLDARKDGRAAKFMAERRDDARRKGITCVISHVDHWTYNLIWVHEPSLKNDVGQFDSAKELRAILDAAWNRVN